MFSNYVMRITTIAILTVCWLAAFAAGEELLWLKSKTLLVASPPGASVWVQNFYTQQQGQELMGMSTTSTSSDIYTNWQRRYSQDNGRSWQEWETIPQPAQPPSGAHRRYPQPGWVDPVCGRMLMMVNDGIFDTGNPEEGFKRWQLFYCVSTDGGRSYAVDRQVIQEGAYTSDHPLEGVYWNQNAAMIGASSCTPIRTRAGKVLVPIQISRSSAGFFGAAVLIGTWGEGEELSLRWDLSERVEISSTLSSRGLFEPTVAEMPNGDILMVCRGSNANLSGKPGYKWYAVSKDGGKTWSDSAP